MNALNDESSHVSSSSTESPSGAKLEKEALASDRGALPLKSRIGLLGKMLLRYASIMKWMLPEVIWRRRGKVILLLMADLLSVGAQITGITIGWTYARMLQKGQMITINRLSLTMDPRESMWLLAAVSLGVLVTWQISSLARFVSDRMALRLSVRFEERCFLRILSTLTDRVRFQDELHGTPMTMTDISRFSNTYIRKSGVASRVILETLIPFSVLLISFFTLMKVSLTLTVLVVCLCILFLPLIWKVNRQSVAAAKNFLKSQPKAGSEKRLLFQKLTSTYTPRARGPEHFESVITGNIRLANESYRRRVLVSSRSQMVTSCLMGVGISLAIALFGFQSLMEGRDWGRLFVYIIALRYFMNNLGRVTSAMVNLNRLYPSFGSLYFFLKTHREHQTVSSAPPGVLTIQSALGKSLPSEPIPQLVLQPAMRLDVVTDIKLSTIVIPHLLESLFGLDFPKLCGLQRETWFTVSDYSLCQMSLREFLQLGAQDTHKTILSDWPGEFVDHSSFAFDSLSLDRPLTEGEWKDIPPSVRSAIALSAAGRSEAELIVLTSSLLSGFTHSVRQAFLERFAEKKLLVFHDGNVSSFNPRLVQASHVILLEGVKMLAILKPQEAKRHADQWDELIRIKVLSGGRDGLDTSAEDDMDLMDL